MNGVRRFMSQPLMPMGLHIWLPRCPLILTGFACWGGGMNAPVTRSPQRGVGLQALPCLIPSHFGLLCLSFRARRGRSQYGLRHLGHNLGASGLRPIHEWPHLSQVH